MINDAPFDYSTVGLPVYQGDGCTACPAQGTELMTKNQWVLAVRDSMYQTFFRARDVYEASNRMSSYAIPEAPYAPIEFRVDGRPDVIDLEWTPHPAGGPAITHWEIYRTSGFPENLLDANGNGVFETVNTVSGEALVTVGAIFMLARFWDVFTDPVLGILSDRYETRWGRRRPFLLFSAIPFGLAFALMFTVPPAEHMKSLPPKDPSISFFRRLHQQFSAKCLPQLTQCLSVLFTLKLRKRV